MISNFRWLDHWIRNREAAAQGEIDRFTRIKKEAESESNRAIRELEETRIQRERRRRSAGY